MDFDLQESLHQGTKQFMIFTRPAGDVALAPPTTFSAAVRVIDDGTASPFFEIVGYSYKSKEEAVEQARQLLVAFFGLSAASQ